MGRPEVKCSMISARIAGFSWRQSPSPLLVTVTKSAPRKTPVTCGRAKSRSASGDRRPAASAEVKFAVPEDMTWRPGRNLRVAGFGVCSVWMNIAMAPRAIGHNRCLSLGVQRPESTLRRRSSIAVGVGDYQTTPCGPPSTHGVKLFERQSTRDNRDRDAQTRSRLARQIGDQRPRTFRTGSCCKHQDRDARLLGDQGQQLVAATALTNVDDRHRAGDWRDLLAQALK